MKKILIVTTSDRMAGAEKNIFDLLRFMDKSKYEFRLVIFKNEHNGELLKRVRELGVRAESLNINSKWQFFKLLKLWRIIRSFKPDILQSFLFFDNQICRIFGRMARVKCIISGLQNVEIKRNFIRNIMDRITVKFVTIVISNSDAGRDFYITNNYISEDKIFVVKNGIDIKSLELLQSDFFDKEKDNVFGFIVPKNTLRIIAVGYLTEQKGMIYLIRAVEILARKNIRVECFIIGQGILMDSLNREIESSKLDDRIHLLGYVSESFKYLKLFDLYVLPSLWEGLPNVVLEAMASKLPVVATSVGGVPEIIKDGETGFLATKGSAKLLALAIENFLSLDRNQKEKMIESAFQFVEKNFNVEKRMKKYEIYYDKYSN